MQRKRRVKEAAIDSTGLSATNASPYFVKRRATKESPWKTITYRRYPKLGVVTNVANHFILAFESGKGPYPDVGQFKGLIQQAASRVKLKTVLADAGYDSEANHQFAREELALRTVIPPKQGRPSDKPIKGRYRRLMQTRFDEQSCRKRAQVETVMSMIKRRRGSFCKGKTYWSRCRELHLMELTHNIMILLPLPTFLQSQPDSFCCLLLSHDGKQAAVPFVADTFSCPKKSNHYRLAEFSALQHRQGLRRCCVRVLPPVSLVADEEVAASSTQRRTNTSYIGSNLDSGTNGSGFRGFSVDRLARLVISKDIGSVAGALSMTKRSVLLSGSRDIGGSAPKRPKFFRHDSNVH